MSPIGFIVKEDYEKKYKDIEEVYKKWLGSFISGNNAMSRISEIINTNYVKANNIKIFDSDNNEICVMKEGTIEVKSK